MNNTTVIDVHPRLIRIRQVMDKVGLGRTNIYARIATKGFPAPRKIGRASLWVEQEVEEWIMDAIKTTGVK